MKFTKNILLISLINDQRKSFKNVMFQFSWPKTLKLLHFIMNLNTISLPWQARPIQLMQGLLSGLFVVSRQVLKNKCKENAGGIVIGSTLSQKAALTIGQSRLISSKKKYLFFLMTFIHFTTNIIHNTYYNTNVCIDECNSRMYE